MTDDVPNFKQKGGRRHDVHDAKRLALARLIMKRDNSYHPYKALKRASVLHPCNLPDPLPEALKNVPIGPNARFADYLTKDQRALLTEEVARLAKSLRANPDSGRWSVETSSTYGSPDYVSAHDAEDSNENEGDEEEFYR